MYLVSLVMWIPHIVSYLLGTLPCNFQENLPYFNSTFSLLAKEDQDGPVSLTWLPDKFESNGLSVQKKKFNIDFQDGCHLWFPIRIILATVDIQSPRYVQWGLSQLSFWFREKVQNRFWTWLLGRPSWISDKNDFSNVWSTSHPDISYQISSQWAFLFRKRLYCTDWVRSLYANSIFMYFCIKSSIGTQGEVG